MIFNQINNVGAHTSLELCVRKIDDWARTPAKSGIHEAGLDLFASWDVLIPAGETVAIPLGIAVEIPEGHFGLICDRSSMGNRGLHVFGGVIDCTYRGQLRVLLHNSTAEDYAVETGDKVAQMVILPVPRVQVKLVEELTASSRGERGFGSSGR